jgi:hypothetical protein
MTNTAKSLPQPQLEQPFAAWICVCLAAALALAGTATAWAQPVASDTPEFTAEELETLVGPIALYPDDLVAIVLPASTYPVQIVQAARLLDDLEDNPSLEPDPSWDNAVVALLNYPEVVHMMNDDLDWTWDLGEAVLNSQASVLDAIQGFRDRAYAAGNLRSDERQVVAEDDGVYSIAPADPEVIYIPYYEPERVVVYQRSPAYYYYADPYPVYYYPYPVGYSFRSGFFWGVTSAFSIGWHSHYLNVYHHSHVGHPYYSRDYYTPYYARRGVNININLNQQTHIWRPTHRHGARPDPDYQRGTRARQIYTREGYTDRGERLPARVRAAQGTQRSIANEGTRNGNARSTARAIGRVDTGRGGTVYRDRSNNGERTTIRGASPATPPARSRVDATASSERSIGRVSGRTVAPVNPGQVQRTQQRENAAVNRGAAAIGQTQRAVGRVANDASLRTQRGAAPASRTAEPSSRARAQPAPRTEAPRVQSNRNPGGMARAMRGEPRQQSGQAPRARQAQGSGNAEMRGRRAR